MRLITHNMLKCNVRGVENGYPLKIEAEKVEVVEVEFDADMVRSTLSKIQWLALQAAATNLSLPHASDVSEVTEDHLADEAFLRQAHHLLFQVRVQEGILVCPDSGRRFPIKDGIPNMLLHEDEV
jgi:multifunctional methyltransferase subunit TRM112